MSTGPESTDRPVARDPQPIDPTPTAGTEPVGRPAEQPVEPAPAPRRRAETAEQPRTPEIEDVKAGGGKTAGIWIALILGAVVLILLLIFVIQNNVKATFEYFGAQFDLPLGVAMLLAAIAGALVMALVGSVRIFQLSWTIRKLRKTQAKIQNAVR
ncbi:lipopolysaccharide assembly protein LapA domain-containing protein [Brachybacterium sp. NBEC-018]|uniref:LapA family protein n=1 Tax=Brachybacterium sp. NBEC-018 TaxID=2996004 RepID=UPI002175670D|nr:lipopolysaccharide assembly protein LapA domain-containing protein [Brachybacterium sp. NBEC-018]UVY83731.1 lipopolysaccharide assembly protein LapA domain-containing protein [Brachybacterium sp. NBEC-018]